MKLLISILPVVFLVVISQIVTKWRLSQLAEKLLNLSGWPKLYIYLTDFYIISAYIISFLASVFWLLVAEKYDISIAFPVYIGLTVILVFFGGVFFLNEPISVNKSVSIALIILGVCIGSKL
jgi:multidrug transporter EmrE-like cation transporter